MSAGEICVDEEAGLIEDEDFVAGAVVLLDRGLVEEVEGAGLMVGVEAVVGVLLVVEVGAINEVGGSTMAPMAPLEEEAGTRNRTATGTSLIKTREVALQHRQIAKATG
jgi:hypothetical protein